MVKKIFIILIASMLLFSFNNIVKADTLENIIKGGQNFVENGKGSDPLNSTSMQDLSGTIYNTLLAIGTIIAVIVGSILGIQFITGSVEQKAKIKDSLIPFVIGCVVIFGAFGIWKLVITILR